MTGEPRLTLAVVNHESAPLVRRLLTTIGTDGIDAVAVFDSGSSRRDRDDLRLLAEELPIVNIVNFGPNVGFGAGMNRAVGHLALADDDVVWLVNPDIVGRLGAAARLSRTLRSSGYEIVSPLITSDAGTRIWFAGGRVDRSTGATDHRLWGCAPAEAGEGLQPTEFMSGAAPMMEGATWRRLAGFREDLFLYWEDADLSVRATSLGMRMAVDPTEWVAHDEGGSASGHGRGSAYYWYMSRNRARLLRDWDVGRPGLSTRMRRGAQTLRLPLRALKEPQGALLKVAASLAGHWLAHERTTEGVTDHIGNGMRVIPVLRAAHVEEVDSPSPRGLLYFTANCDLGPEQIPAHAVRVSMLTACKRLILTERGALELFEPLWIEYVGEWLVLALVWRATRFGRPRRDLATFFAIENGRATDVASRGRWWLRPLGEITVRTLRRSIPKLTDRVVFGTASASETYRALVCESPMETRLQWDLLASRADAENLPNKTVVFVGAMERRKGLRYLAAAWEQVERHHHGATLTLIGEGPLAEELRGWASGSPATRCMRGSLSRDEIFAILRRSTVLVAPSVRSKRWREQVGRPIQEALSCGLTVVTTDETGLAPYLASRGHYVLPASDLERELAVALISALSNPLPKQDVLEGLPARDGRLEADDWLHEHGA